MELDVPFLSLVDIISINWAKWSKFGGKVLSLDRRWNFLNSNSYKLLLFYELLKYKSSYFTHVEGIYMDQY